MDGHKNISFRLLSWQEADIEKLGWEKAFDLVLAHMTPAVNSRAALDKMRRVSRGWCIVTKSVYRNCAVADGVNAICGRAADSYGHREILELLETLWQEGYTPEVFYERERWENCLNEEKAADMYIKRMALRGDISEEKKEGIRRFMASVSENGVVNERTDAVLCTVCWKENGR